MTPATEQQSHSQQLPEANVNPEASAFSEANVILDENVSLQAFESLFHYAQQFTPYLHGQVSAVDTQRDAIVPGQDNSAVMAAIFDEISQATPAAGQAFWLTRTWGLLCWQPIFLSFIAIYSAKKLPNMTRIAQYRQPLFVAGFSFEPHAWQSGRRANLIRQAATQLNHLFEQYRLDLNESVRIRPGFTQHLLADSLLNCLIRLQQIRPAYTNQDIVAQARLWLEAFGLPDKHLSSLKLDEDSGKVKLVRTSCCLVYKCEGRALCGDCPRLDTNKHCTPLDITLVD
ncbi:siderophore ferric iron reductase [Vibrio sp. ABG19]|uniref:siderophore ferric iron reductase n=1 Tax=Vibrio sp. ABG19 TaxID=2817385 RepID=UPI00249F4F8A|nr:siderophore ferric iron reductase [Vibrio sp. ABG19]